MQPYDFNRGLMTLLGAGVAGFLAWVATQIGQNTTGRFWASMGVVAAAGLVLATSQLVGGWTKWGMPRFSLGVFLAGFLPVLVCVGWVLLATQPGSGWQEGRLVSWSHSIGIFGAVHALGLYHGVLALGFGLAFGLCFDTAGLRVRGEAPVASMEPAAADEPLAAERDEAGRVPVGPSARRLG